MRDAGTGLGLPGGQALPVEYLDDLGSQQGFGLPHLCVGMAEVAKHIPTAADQLQVVVHRKVSFRRFSRSATKSISALGVLAPLFAFFSKACTTQTSAPSCTA